MDSEARNARASLDETRSDTQRREEFDTVVKARRAAAHVNDEDGHRPWALSLSGGGVRSATFCVGLLRGLAKNELLTRFDYLSTVSGGGYAGVSFARLFKAGVSAKQVEQGIQRDDSMWLWWLRNNGRYLTPAGAKDLSLAGASMLRGVIATHGEVGVLTVLITALIVLPHVVLSVVPPPHGSGWSVTVLAQLGSVWWWCLAIPLFAVAHQILMYWFRQAQKSPVGLAVIAVTAAASAALAWFWGASLIRTWNAQLGDAWGGWLVLRFMTLVVLLAPATAWASMLVEIVREVPLTESRLIRTRRLAYSLWALIAVACVGALDRLSWWLAAVFNRGEALSLPYKAAAILAALVAIGRFIAPQIQKWQEASKSRHVNVERLLNVAGCLGMGLVFVLWATVLNVVVFPPVVWSHASPSGAPAWLAPQVVRWLVAFAVCLLYTLMTRRSIELLNLSSLHNFYRARIERTYVSTGNSEGEAARFRSSLLEPKGRTHTAGLKPLTQVVAHDDVPLVDYAPHVHGGPIHLINCCINQSIDDRTGVYNADRKGVALAVGALGAETGTRFPEGPRYATDPGTLSRWIAISGAATSTGMGSRTSPGLANLLFMSGFRLGNWTHSLQEARPRRDLRTLLVTWLTKPAGIVAESLARFPGLNSPLWYVSDGGHFDNTGIYALLKRRPELIVAADCGADPQYLFDDLESLVRKAKIDYSTEIKFLDPEAHPNLAPVLGTPETIGPDPGLAWLVIGRIEYPDGLLGTLLVVKPRRLLEMPFDLVAYADRNPEFPQQSTVDQFFDEAQWEAYHQLGLMVGRNLTESLLLEAKAAVTRTTDSPSNLALASESSAPKPSKDRSRRLGTGVRASLGAGLSLSVVLAAWQGLEQYRESQQGDEKAYAERYAAARAHVDSLNTDLVLPGDFDDLVALAKESDARDDGEYARIRSRLNAHCEALQDATRKAACGKFLVDLNRQVDDELHPRPLYDYWFADSGFAKATRSTPTTTPTPPRVATASMSTASAPIATTDAMEGWTAPVATGIPLPSSASPGCGSIPAANVRVFFQIYDELSRPAAVQLCMRMQSQFGVTGQGVENVLTTAKRQDREPPYVWIRPAIVYKKGFDQACLDQLASMFPPGLPATLRPLRRYPASTLNDVEVWLPPRYEPTAQDSTPAQAKDNTCNGEQK